MNVRTLMGRRTRALQLVLAATFVFLIYNLVNVQFVSQHTYQLASNQELTTTIPIPAVRGGIYDRNGQVLAETVTRQTAVVDQRQVPHPLAAAECLAPVLHLSLATTLDDLTGTREFVYLGRRLPDAVAAQVAACKVTGVSLIPETQREMPDGLLAEPVIGTVNWDGNGAGGLESQYQTQLAGRAGSKTELMWNGVALPSGSTSTTAQPGVGLELTMDESVQYIAEQALAAEIKAAHALGGTAVVMDVHSGDILAMANLSATTPASASAPVSTSRTEAPSTMSPLSAGAEEVSSTSTLPSGVVQAPSNSAVTQDYEPGSVFKIVTFSSALAHGLITPQSVIGVPSQLTMNGSTFHDAEVHGAESMTATQILAQSSNIGTIEVAEKVGETGLLEQVANLGFGQLTSLNFPGESAGLMREGPNWNGTTLGALPIGQVDSVPPLQVLDAYNAVANGGVFVEPRLVRGFIQADGSVQAAPASAAHQVIDSATNAELVQMLRAVVASGTGTSASIDGYTVAGKTGTAQIPDNVHGGYVPGAYMASFVGFAPTEHPVLSAIVVLDRPTPIYGGAVAAPVFSTIMAYALHHYGIATTTTATGTSQAAIGAKGTTAVPAGALEGN